jgi:hypothetical protein
MKTLLRYTWGRYINTSEEGMEGMALKCVSRREGRN